jgi:hypothetical protein
MFVFYSILSKSTSRKINPSRVCIASMRVLYAAFFSVLLLCSSLSLAFSLFLFPASDLSWHPSPPHAEKCFLECNRPTRVKSKQ